MIRAEASPRGTAGGSRRKSDAAAEGDVEMSVVNPMTPHTRQGVGSDGAFGSDVHKSSSVGVSGGDDEAVEVSVNSMVSPEV